MALFKSAEQKEAEAQEKALKMLSKYGLENLTNEKDVESVRKIMHDLMGTGMMEAGMTLTLGGKASETLPVYYQRAIIEQNWIIIRQLDRIAKLLEDKYQTSKRLEV